MVRVTVVTLAGAYKHAGYPVFLVAKGKGDVLLNPCDVEKYVYLRWSTRPSAHSCKSYLKGLMEVARHVPDLPGDHRAGYPAS